MADVSTLAIRVTSEGIQEAKRGLDDLTNTGRKAESGIGALGAAGRAAGIALSGLMAAMSVRQVIQYADSWKLLSSRIDIATASALESANVQREVFAMAQNLGIGLDEAAGAFTRLSQSVKEMGGSSRDALGRVHSNCFVVSFAPFVVCK